MPQARSTHPTLFDRRLLIVAGKGGVGRTTVACALALAAARQGKRVLLAQVKSKDRLPRLFGVAHNFAEVQPIDTNLWGVNMTPEASLREYGVMVLRSAFLYRQVFERDVVRAFLRAIPGLYDYSMLGKAWFHTTETVGSRPRFDLVVLDAPATGHALTLLAIPKVICDTVPEGPLTGPARDCQSLLTDSARTLAVLVTLAEDLPVSETIQLSTGLRGLGIHLGPVVVNRLYPPRFKSGVNALALDELLASSDLAAGESSALPAVLRAASLQRQRSALNEHYVKVLKDALPLPQLHAPYIFNATFARPAIEALADRIGEQVEAQKQP
jgi:anion-transporting  ArsA/GET3 family ATPase